MFPWSLLLTIPIITERSNTPKPPKCNGEIYNMVYLEREVLFMDLEYPSQLILDHLRDTLYYRQTILGTKYDFSAITICKIINKKCIMVKDIRGGYAIARDPEHDEIYMGGQEGIYKYNLSINMPTHFAEEGKSVRDIFIGKNFYYVQNPNGRLYVKDGNKFDKVDEAKNIEMDHFYVSRRNNIYYSNRTGLYKVKTDSTESHLLSDKISTVQITENTYGEIHFASSEGIFIEDRNHLYINQVADIKRISGLAFDARNNPILAVGSTIFRLLPSDKEKACYHVKLKQMYREKDLTPKKIL